jgi:hypothetical protein
VATLVLAAMGGYFSWLALEIEIGYRQCAAAPADHAGRRLVFPLWVVTAIDDADRFRISKVVQGVPVLGDSTGLAVGDTISLEGTFNEVDLTVTETRRELHPHRAWKERLGALGFLVTLLAAPRMFRVRAGRLVERG